MAKEIVTKCDVCGNPGEDVRTYTIRYDDHTWEVDLDAQHAGPLMKIVAKGRESEVPTRRPQDVRALERRIRNQPS